MITAGGRTGDVRESRGYEKPTAIANAPAYTEGIVNLRDAIVPIEVAPRASIAPSNRVLFVLLDG